MRKILFPGFLMVLLGLLAMGPVGAQTQWPRQIPISNGGSITIYQPQPESFNGNKISSRSAVSVKTSASAEPVFGAVWSEVTTQTDRDRRMLTVEALTIKQVKFPGEENPANIEKFKKLLEEEVPKWELTFSLDELVATLEEKGISANSADLNTAPPKIIYSNKPATLVLIDGEPKVEKDKESGMQRVINTPFPIIKEGSKYYLFTGKYWYVSSSVLNGWSNTTSLPSNLKQVDTELKKQAKEQLAKAGEAAKALKDETPTAIIVSTEPAELIQTEGSPDYQSLEGTSLLFVSNSPNDIFKDISSQKTFVLIAGRWYSAPGINGPWSYQAADKLPEDFAKIREGGEKDNVLASVAGTSAANEAVLDAMIPQTATVDRKTATVQEPVKYDGTPQFEKIQGTSLELAVNTGSTVLRQNGMYYTVDNGIWFESNSASGPWRVSTKRPTDVENIPATSSAYNTKYVEIYDVRPDVVVVGYTPGYMNSYIYGPTVVYGTGYPYNPWWRNYYYPRPVTWGFGMNYNPWTGWGFNWGFNFSMGPFSMGFGSGGFSFGFGFGFGYGGGGWFGPPIYRPPYRPPYWNGGYYRPGGGYNRPGWGNNNNINIGGDVNINIGGNQNIYNKGNHKGVVTRDINRRPGSGNYTGSGNTLQANKPGERPSTRPGTNTRPTSPNTRPGSNANPGSNTRLPTTSQPQAKPARPETRPAQPEARPAMPEARPAARPEARPARPDNDKSVLTDRSGNVYKRDDNGNWNQRDQNTWRPSNSNQADLDRMQRQRDRANYRNRSYNQVRPSMPSGRPSSGYRPSSRPVSRPASRPATRPSPSANRRG